MDILLIDDEPIIHQSLGGFLQRAGHQIRTAVNGHEGLQLAEAQTPDLIISDIKMPGLNGLDLLDRLKMRVPTTPVVLITGHGDVDTAVTALHKGAYSYLRKPVKLDELVNVVQRIDQRQDLESSMLRERERLAQSGGSESMGQFAAGIAHEINNPNTMIRGNLQTFTHIWKRLEPALRRCIDDGLSAELIDEIPGLVHSMLHGTDRIKQIVEQVQHYSGDKDPSESEVDLRHCLDAVLEDGFLDLERLDLDDGLPHPCPIRAEAVDLVRALTHLLQNAADAIAGRPDGKITLSLETAGRDWIKIAVADNGPGIDEATAAQIFDPFFTTKDPGRGTGMGLSICQRIVGELGGEIAFESQPDRGARFWIRLPLAKAATAAVPA